MAVPRTTRWEIEPHTRVKHRILRRYLQAWLPIMATQSGRILYIDGFAGPGRYSKGEEGSPLIALRALLEHSYLAGRPPRGEFGFFFIEADKDRAGALEAEIGNLASTSDFAEKSITCEVVRGEFADVMSGILDDLERGKANLAPTFAFIDPFGVKGVPFEIVARILANPRCECLVTFMFQTIYRFLEARDPAMERHFDALFGTSEWRALVGEPDPVRRRDGILGLYRRQLLEQARVRHVRTFEMLDRGDKTEYFLFFATNNDLGLSKMKAAMWSADPEEGGAFSDRTDPRQRVLFGEGPDIDLLTRLLRDPFRGKGPVPIDAVERFVLTGTAFSEVIHLKKRTLKPMEGANPSMIRVRRPPPGKQGTFARGATIEFL